MLYKFDDDKQRARWSNLPTGMVPRGGLSLGELSDAQRSTALALVASTLSQRGLDAITRTRLSMVLQRIRSAGISVAGVCYLCLALTGNS